MKLVVGLGNPDERYRRTFHNMGFTAVGDVAAILGTKFKKRQCEAICAEANANGEKVILARPLTYMNCSGRAVKQLMEKYKLTERDLVVIYDDFDLPKGNVRIRAKGSAGTHNGMRSAGSEIGTSDFVRIRIGIKDDAVDMPLIDYVLSDVKEEDYDLFVSACKRAANAAAEIVRGVSVDNVMSRYND